MAGSSVKRLDGQRAPVLSGHMFCYRVCHDMAAGYVMSRRRAYGLTIHGSFLVLRSLVEVNPVHGKVYYTGAEHKSVV